MTSSLLATITLLGQQPIPILIAAPMRNAQLTINKPTVAQSLMTSGNLVATLAPIYTAIAVPSNVVNMAMISVVSERGAQGPIGPLGPKGIPGGHNLTFQQTVPATLWEVNHNFGVNPSVTTIDINGKIIEGDVTYLDVNNLSIYFSEPISGNAYII